MQEEKELNTFLRILKDNWAVFILVVSLIVSWTNFISADQQAAQRIVKLETSENSLAESQVLIRTQLAQIQTDLQWIKQRLK